MRRLPVSFYERPVLEVARELIGCVVSHDGTSGVIVETEAYHQSEPACHAFRGLTPRTTVLFGAAGTAYVYKSYGVHALLNAVCEESGVGAAVLIRALAPRSGIAAMRARRGAAGTLEETELCSGPGKLTQALGIDMSMNASSLIDGPVAILEPGSGSETGEIVASPRIGITKAPELPWRFSVRGDRNVSRPRPPMDGGPARVIRAASKRPAVRSRASTRSGASAPASG